MATSRTASYGKGRGALNMALRRLRDEIIDLYLDWREEAAAAADAYALWTDATWDDRAAHFVAFMAAIDREEAAALSYAAAVANGERVQGAR